MSLSSELITKFQLAYQKQNAVSMTTDLLLDIDLKSYYENQNTIEAKERWSNVEELLNSITDFQEYREGSGLTEFLEEVSLLTDIDRWNETDKAITLMTIHSAKGLEFPVVIVAGLEEGFSITMETDDIIDFGSYSNGIKILKKYNINI